MHEAATATTLTPRAIENTVARMPGWSLEQGHLAKQFAFASRDEAARFASIFARRAVWSGCDLDVSLRGASLNVKIPPTGERLTKTDIQFARRLDLAPGTDRFPGLAQLV